MVGNGTCETCHNKTIAKGTSTGHIPVGAPAFCETCHRNFTSFSNPTMDHSKVTATPCGTCHNGAYVSEGTNAGGAIGKPAGHIPETKLWSNGTTNCNVCHTTSTYTSVTNWGTILSKVPLHNSTLGATTAPGVCTACHATGSAPTLGNMQKKALNHDGGKSVKIDCSQSGCHRPQGNVGLAYSAWKL
jgi:hypothetical protein